MHRTRTPLRLWFWRPNLVATHTPGISAVQLKRQLGISRSETAWPMLQKLRRAMVAPERELLRSTHARSLAQAGHRKPAGQREAAR